MANRQLIRAALIAAIVLTGCGIEISAGPERPMDAVAIRMYTRSQQAEKSYRVTSEHADPVLGEVLLPVRATCFYVGGAWELRVLDGTVADPIFEPLAVTEGDGPPNTPADIWISVDDAGEVHIGRGVPEWWTGDIQNCV